jgi:hypothetical protein
MQKRTMINKINAIIREHGSFSIGELDHEDCSPCVGELGSYVGLAEEFKVGQAQVNVYMPSSFSSDPEDEYDMDYIDMEKYIVEEILRLAELWEVDSLKSEERISN